MIWCVEDDADIRDMEIYTLQSTGFTVKGFSDGKELFEALKLEQPELILLDIMLPGEDGTKILRKLKTSTDTCHIPVIMATAKGTEYDKIQNLDLGADDYLVKPFGMMEMVSRVKAVLRRCNPSAKNTVLTAGKLALNLKERTVTVEGERVQLTYKEFELLKCFLSHPGMVFTREQLLSDIWGMDYDGETRTIDIHVRTLRQKIGPCADMIQTVRRVGYRLEVLS